VLILESFLIFFTVSTVGSIAQQKFVTGFGAPAQYFKQLGNNLYQPSIYLCPTAVVIE
jgi:hypothetical protein